MLTVVKLVIIASGVILICAVAIIVAIFVIKLEREDGKSNRCILAVHRLRLSM